MWTFNRTQNRTGLYIFRSTHPRAIDQEYNHPARLLLNGYWVSSFCLGCANPKCMYFSEEEISCHEFPDFAYDRNNSVCPFSAMSWDYEADVPHINHDACIKCGLCAIRCPMGALYSSNGRITVSRPYEAGRFIQKVQYNNAGIQCQQQQLTPIERIAWHHRFQKESDVVLHSLYSSLSQIDGRSNIANLLVRNLLICLGYHCAVSRIGDVYTRTDAVYSGGYGRNYTLGAIEIEFGRDTLDASRGILDDIAVFHSRNNIDKNTNSALVVCLSFPNRRQGYLQVIKDIRQVLNLEIQTFSVGALFMFAWNSAQINLARKEFYVDFDSLSIREATNYRLGRAPEISDGYLGILEPEK